MLAATRVVMVHPFFPENIGAAARAMKNSGLERLIVAEPGPMGPDHPNALKMAVMAEDILARAELVPTLDSALAGASLVIGTTRHVYEGMVAISPREAARLANQHAAAGGEVALVFGNEKNGLTKEALRRSHQIVRIPSAAENTSLNLAQALMIVAYEWLIASEDQFALEGTPVTVMGLEPRVAEVATDLAEALQQGGFFKPHNRSEKEALLRRVLSRAILDPVEASVFRGLARRLGRVLARHEADRVRGD